MVTGNVPVVAVAEAVNVATLLLPVVGSGLNVAVTPAGSAARAQVHAGREVPCA